MHSLLRRAAVEGGLTYTEEETKNDKKQIRKYYVNNYAVVDAQWM